MNASTVLFFSLCFVFDFDTFPVLMNDSRSELLISTIESDRFIVVSLRIIKKKQDFKDSQFMRAIKEKRKIKQNSTKDDSQN